MIGGANDIVSDGNPQYILDLQAIKVVTAYTNVLIVTVPQRYDFLSLNRNTEFLTTVLRRNYPQHAM